MGRRELGKVDKEKEKRERELQRDKQRSDREKAREQRAMDRGSRDDGLGAAVSAGATASSSKKVSSPAGSPSKKRSADSENDGTDIESPVKKPRKLSNHARLQPAESDGAGDISDVSASSSDEEGAAAGATVSKADSRRAADLLKKKSNIKVNRQFSSLVIPFSSQFNINLQGASGATEQRKQTTSPESSASQVDDHVDSLDLHNLTPMINRQAPTQQQQQPQALTKAEDGPHSVLSGPQSQRGDEKCEDGKDCDDSDEEGEGSGKGKDRKRPRKSGGKSKERADHHFKGTGQLHALTRRAVVIWNASAGAVDVADSAHHEDRLNGARLAVEAFNILGLRGTASEFMKGDYLHESLFGFAQHADKVNLFLTSRY